MRKILIVGATSAIAMAVARDFAANNDRLFLVARDNDKLTSVANDLIAKGADRVETFMLDVNDIEQHSNMLEYADESLGGLDTVLVAHGTLPSQQDCELSVNSMLQEFNTNSISTIALLTEISNKFEQQKSGTIAVITSVAGDRGRQSNYVYGAAKATVSTFLEGLRARMFKSSVHVLDIRPGFVDTPMTSDLKLPQLLTVQPEIAASCIVKAIDSKKSIVYVPFYWKYIMLIIKLMPMMLFKRLSL
ncbi:SDR family oxidoreductase [Vibrio barjaei]|uniref:SDR family oxidoreductase n=1 Tax=Vibrio barjaei TaxID=1676683 RepID=UPI0022836AA0|nr:SDR family oxidoreductase [Vibrio barjaei]MCY9872554.1 SDR family oxidoreductase [Vibrio barjaei]